MVALTPRWTPLRTHLVQSALWHSKHRFNVNPAGRRSGKTELAKRKLIIRALEGTAFPDPRFFAAAPTRDQAKRIYWKDLKSMIPKQFLRGKPSESELVIPLLTGAEIHVLGMDKPERVEGSPWDGGILDEYGNMKAHAWGDHVFPAFADRNGWCDLIGVPEGRNHYYDLYKMALAQLAEFGDKSDWGAFHWVSEDILSADQIRIAKLTLDPQTYEQEYLATFLNFQGRIYYPFNENEHCARLFANYNPRARLNFCFDFNVDPGVCAVSQEMEFPEGGKGTGWIGEVYIPNNSNTPAVCRKLISSWGKHEGQIFCYGDATGGARGSAKVMGSDWDLVKATLGSHFSRRQLFFKVPKSNPAERARVNAMNTRLKNTAGDIRMMFDPSKCPELVKDMEGVQALVGGSGEIDKKTDSKRTHISDGAGYYVARRFPVSGKQSRSMPIAA